MSFNRAIVALALSLGAAGFSVASPIPLDTALDSGTLVWESSTNYPWYGTNYPSPTYDGVDSAVSGNRFVSNSASWLQTTVVGPGVLSFWWKVDSDPTDNLQFLIGGVVQDQIAGLTDWAYHHYTIGPGTNVLQWKYVKDIQYNSGEDRGWLDQVHYLTGAQMALQEALNTCGVTWTSGGNENPTLWTGQTNLTHDGLKAARSGAIYNLQQSWLQTSVVGVTNVSFWWMVSSEYDTQPFQIYDTLGFYIDGVLQANINVENQWQQKSYPLSPGSHTLQWIYSKDDSDILPKGEDCAFLDQVVFNPSMKAFPYSLKSPVLLPDGRVQLTLAGEAGCPCRVDFSTNLGSWQTLSNFVTTTTNSVILDGTAANSPARFYRAVSP